jgi:hypothetical protein
MDAYNSTVRGSVDAGMSLMPSSKGHLCFGLHEGWPLCVPVRVNVITSVYGRLEVEVQPVSDAYSTETEFRALVKPWCADEVTFHLDEECPWDD